MAAMGPIEKTCNCQILQRLRENSYRSIKHNKRETKRKTSFCHELVLSGTKGLRKGLILQNTGQGSKPNVTEKG